METQTRDQGTWSELPTDLVGSFFSRLSLADFHRAKLVCRNWSTSCKLAVTRKRESPWLILFPDGDNSCMLYNPEEDKVYNPLRDFSGTRFLANSGKWFLMVDSQTNLYIIDIFSEKRIDLLPLESLPPSTIKRVGDKKFPFTQKANVLRGLLWVNEETEDYVVVRFFDRPSIYLRFCKKGDAYYTEVSLHFGVIKKLQKCSELVLRDYRLYILTVCGYIRVLDFSGQEGYVDVTGIYLYQMFSPRRGYQSSGTSIVVTTAGEVLLVESITVRGERSFHIYKKEPDHLYEDGYYHELYEVDSLGDEALLLDLGITVPANHTLGIKPNSIYFTCHDRACLRIPYSTDVCVFNLETNTLKRFPALDNMNLKDARWFLPMS